ncbi:DUF559 domain-containing protein [Rhizobium sp. CG5]|uniref:endonuclease domain-containing protein n=1 Tax=Rhizobium sp. CG5 TaxID=2726076 RepID=UPI0020341337|nr:DUF559 domain-containing protein [Rhizobium sp. CG5]MCM2475829.1 DUF559 domain-containing protein [Rhizobium sp. CG5]
MRGARQATTSRARSLRKVDNDAEGNLWSELRNRRLNGFKFVRQLPIGPYFADFACRDQNLVVEIDGSQHAESLRDAVRNHHMIAEGWSVVRFWNTDVLRNMPSVLETIVAILDGRVREPVEAADLTFIPARCLR